MAASQLLTDVLNRNVRFLVQTVLGMPDNSVSPANQKRPRGAQSAERATVFIPEISDRGWAAPVRVSTSSDGASITEGVDALKEFTASVNFYGQPAADPAGLATFSTAALARAARLNQVLQLEASAELMEQLGLGYMGASKARDLTAVVDANYESRGQVDLYFCIVNRETAVVPTIAIANITFNFQAPGGAIKTTTLEVPL